MAAKEEIGIDLGSNRFIQVSEFKGKALIQIREFYKDKSSQELKPGKKGIALSLEQYKKLKESLDEIDEKIKNFEK